MPQHLFSLIALAALPIAMAGATVPSAALGEAPAPAWPPAALLAAPPASSEQLWQLRSGLNVAALMCPDRAIAKDYNWLLRAQAPLLAQAWSAEQRRYQLRHGRGWQAAQDRSLTSQYNRLANAGNRHGFCLEARRILTEARRVPAAAFAHYASGAAVRLGGEARALEYAAR